MKMPCLLVYFSSCSYKMSFLHDKPSDEDVMPYGVFHLHGYELSGLKFLWSIYLVDTNHANGISEEILIFLDVSRWRFL